MSKHGVFRAALNGIHARGTGGFVYVQGDECCYMFPSELEGCADAASTLEEMLSDTETASRVLYVVENRDARLHILAYPKEDIYRALVGESNQCGAAASPVVEEEEEETASPTDGGARAPCSPPKSPS